MEKNIINQQEYSGNCDNEHSTINKIENSSKLSNEIIINKYDDNGKFQTSGKTTNVFNGVNIKDSGLILSPPPPEQTIDLQSRYIKKSAFQISSNFETCISVRSIEHKTPQSLFLLAFAKVHESSVSSPTAYVNQQKSFMECLSERGNIEKTPSSEITAPDSLTSAPPSYSFVLRQMARRKPRLMGTFIPSPSFVNHTPPPNYGTAFDIYIDNPIHPPQRVYHFGYMPMLFMCPECGYIGMTIVTSKVTISTHLCALVLCLFCCWICAPLPYVLRSCKKVYHYCRNCRTLVGIYSPSQAENPPP